MDFVGGGVCVLNQDDVLSNVFNLYNLADVCAYRNMVGVGIMQVFRRNAFLEIGLWL